MATPSGLASWLGLSITFMFGNQGVPAFIRFPAAAADNAMHGT